MGLVTFEITYDAIQRAVKQETSHYGIRQTDSKGDALFEQLVMDEAYDEKCRELFHDAKARILVVMAPYTRDIPVAAGYVDETDRDYNIDFIQTLDMPDDWNWQLLDAVNATLKEFFVAYITARWYETKNHQAAALLGQRAGAAVQSLQSTLNSRVRFRRRPHRWF